MARGLAFAAILIGALAFAFWGITAETGPVAWVNALQLKIFGSYSVKMTMIVLIMALFVIGAICAGIWNALIKPLLGEKIGGQIEATFKKHATALNAPTQKTVTKQQGLVAAVVMLVVVWVGAYGYYQYVLHEHSVDADAQYFRVDLATGDASAAAGHDHLMVHGQYIWDAVLGFHSGSDKKADYSLIPIAGRGWKKGDPVPFVAKVDDATSFSSSQRQEKDPYTFLAVPEGGVPTTSLGEFEKNGVIVNDATRMLRVVPAHDGKPDFARDLGEDKDNFWIAAIAGSVICGMAILALLGAMLIARLRSPQGRPA